MTRVAVMGAGAIGTWLGAALAEAGEDVTLVARGAHLAALQDHGARLRLADGERAVAVRAVGTPAEVEGPVDVLLLTLKAHDLPAAAAGLRGLVGPDTTVVSAQNGIPWWWFHPEPRGVAAVDPDGAIARALPPSQALGAVVYLGGSVPEPGTVATRPEAGLVLGEPDGTASERLEAVASLLERAGFPVRRTGAIRMEVWTKLMGNASFNLVGVLTRAGLGTMATDPGTAAILRQVMEEVVAIASAAGGRPELSVEQRLAVAARLGDHKPSTLQDLEAGKRLELDALGAAVLELADAAGVPVPTLRTVYALADLQARTLGLR